MIVDDHTIMRDGLQALLSADPHYEVVGTAADGKSAVRSVAALQPDIILMDLTMPVGEKLRYFSFFSMR